ncbi:MAG: CBS domain-containing protein [Methanobacteriota archaeon]|nr:MAG: CBS domain-containing protein [Euryarchaeota archaeon]
MKEYKVKDYMTTELLTVRPDQGTDEVVELIERTGHDSFPVVSGERLVGIITARDLIFRKDRVSDAMSKRVVVTYPETRLIDAARVMFREGHSKLPVVDEDKRPIGIITNMDILRSHIERATPEKVNMLTRYIENLYRIKTTVRVSKVDVQDLRPTQNKISPDELRGREYELKRGLAEPIVVVKVANRTLLVDGHHRALAALRSGIKTLTAYVITVNEDITLGIEKTADRMGIHTLEDLKETEDTFKEIAEIIESG